MLAMSIAAVILVVGIVVSTGVGLLHANQMEEQLNDRITSTNVHLTSSMENMNARISNTIQQAISDGDTRLADSSYHVEYDHETRSFVVDLYAHPKTLGTFQDVEFTFVQRDGERLSTEAQLVNGRFEGTIIITDLGQECISGDVYLTWLEDEKTIAELIQFYDRWTYFDRLMITSAWMDTQQRQDSVVSVKPWASVRLCFDAPDTYPVSIRYDIYSGGERIATVT